MDSGFNAVGFFVNLIILSLLVLPVFYFCRHAWSRRFVLIVFGATLLFLIAPRLLLFYLAYWLVISGAHIAICATSEKPIGIYVFWTCLVAALAPMVVWKIFPFHFVTEFNLKLHSTAWLLGSSIGQADSVRNAILPLGLSFASFRAADLMINSYLGVQARLKLDRVLFYGFFAPVQVIGPVIQYGEIEKSAEKAERLKVDDISAGAGGIAMGFFKVMVLALPLQNSVTLFSTPPENMACKWLVLILFTWYFYLNFAGYSDMAIGAARLFGYRLKPNFDFPFFKSSLQEFWNGWHMSLTRFCQRNVFIPLGGYRKNSEHLALYSMMITIGLWHDIKWSFVLYGVFHASGIMLERILRTRFALPSRASGLLGVALNLAVFMFVALGMPMVMLPVNQLLPFYISLFRW